jgi:outer membrane lipoprotein-sorting protein
MKLGIPAAVLSVAILYFGSVDARPERVEDAVAAIRAMATQYAAVQDYTATFLKKERDPQPAGDLWPLETIELKFARPFRVYMKWLAGPSAGQEILYVDSENDNKLLVRPARRPISVWLNRDCNRLKRRNRHVITEVGLGYLIEQLVQNVDRAWAAGVARIVDHGIEREGGTSRRKLELSVSGSSEAYYAARTLLWIDTVMGLPVRADMFDRKGQLVESYTYNDLRINVGLGRDAFDRHNAKYRFGSPIYVPCWIADRFGD